MARIWRQNLASLRVFREQRKFSVTGAAARPHTKDTKVTEATSLCFADAFSLGNPFPGFETRSAPDSLGALPIAPLPSISEIPFPQPTRSVSRLVRHYPSDMKTSTQRQRRIKVGRL